MSSQQELGDKIIVAMQALAEEEQWPIKFDLLARLVNTVVENWYLEIDDQLKKLITDWEAAMGDDDKTLYTLGVRRALDKVRGEERPLNS
jgi:hypothetical protein